MKNSFGVAYHPSRQQQACEFADQLGVACTPEDAAHNELCLLYAEDHVALLDRVHNTRLQVDFIGGALAHRKKYGGGRGQAIAKAVGLKPGVNPPRVLDATAGLGKDAFVLACLGCSLTLVERSPVVAALLADGIERGRQDADFAAMIEHGFHLVNAQAADYMRSLQAGQHPEVVYLDPMYPERKKTAQVKKNMQMLQKLLGQDEDTQQLLQTALGCARKRVVVKRPKGADIVPGPKPTTCIESKKTRYDVYVVGTF